MRVPILKTKLYIPPERAGLVSRPRLMERIDRGLAQGHKMTIVSAPAGFGKTTLLSDWIHQRERQSKPGQVAWVSLDERDNEWIRFWTYVLEAFSGLSALSTYAVGRTALEMLASPQVPPVEAVLTELINDVVEVGMVQPVPRQEPATTALDRLILVLDDYHVITSQQVSQGLCFLIDNMPPSMHVVLATRADPALPISRLRGRQLLTEITAADLRFGPEEAVVFLNQAMELGLSAEEVAALEQRTEGWIVGLQMAAKALRPMVTGGGRNAHTVSDYIAAFTGSHRYVLDYLTDEVLSREPEAVQRFLLETSILKRLSGPLCDAVTGGPGGQNMLERLDASNLFIVPLDGDRQWYRYHHLFADLLVKRLKRAHPELVNDLYRRASAWYEGADLIEEAIVYGLAGADYERSVKLVEAHAVRQMMSSRKETTIATWLDAFPTEILDVHPWLSVYMGWTRYWMGERDEVEPCLLRAEQALKQKKALGAEGQGPDPFPDAERKLIAGYTAAIRAHHALTNRDIPRVVQMANRAIDFLPEGDYMRCEAAVALGGAYWSEGDIKGSQAAFSQARATALQSGYPPLAVPSACYVAMQQTKQAHLHEAHETYQEALMWATGANNRLLPVAGFPLIKIGDLLREWNDLEAAERDISHGIELCKQLGQADVLAEAYVMRVRLELAQGKLDQVPGSLQQVAGITHRVNIDPWIASWADDCRLDLWLRTGDERAVDRWLEQNGPRLDADLDYQRDLDHLQLARVLIARCDVQTEGPDPRVWRLLDRLLDASLRAGWIQKEISIHILRSLAFRSAGNREQALEEVERALVLAEPGGYVRIFCDGGDPMADLLRQAFQRGLAVSYVGHLFAAFEGQSDVEQRVASTAVEPLLEPLTEREMEVLVLVAEGLSNREIGERLYITRGTVKAHTSNIYSKLGVQNRTQAVARARSLGLLGSSRMHL